MQTDISARKSNSSCEQLFNVLSARTRVAKELETWREEAVWIRVGGAS
jgi:hypothetical protein